MKYVPLTKKEFEEFKELRKQFSLKMNARKLYEALKAMPNDKEIKVEITIHKI